MVDTRNLLEPHINLIDNEDIKDTVRDTARIYYEGTGATVNLISSLIIGLLALLGLLKLLAIPILASFGLGGDDGGESGYGAPTGVYGEPFTGYGRAYSSRSGEAEHTITDLQAQVAQLQESELHPQSQNYYNIDSASVAVNGNQIGFTS